MGHDLDLLERIENIENIPEMAKLKKENERLWQTLWGSIDVTASLALPDEPDEFSISLKYLSTKSINSDFQIIEVIKWKDQWKTKKYST